LALNQKPQKQDKEMKMTSTKKSAPKAEGFTAEEKAAMKARAQELKAEAKASKNREEGEKAVLTAIAQMKDSTDRSMAKRIHELVTAAAPELMPKTWYGMPAYADNDGKVICFFQAASKFGVRYATFGFQPDANLDEGNMWAASFALVKLTAAEEAKITALVKKAVG
jgi:uncharacterized protein YdhG (YjbR/CyaY superfamily)